MTARITPLDPWIRQKIACPDALRRDRIESYQLQKVQETLALVRSKSRFYQNHLKYSPPTLSGLDGLAHLPFTTAEDLREHGGQFLCVSQDEIERVVTLDTSGTSGPPKRIYFTQADQELTIDFFQVGMSTFTAPGDKVLILLPCERAGSVGDLLATALGRMGAQPVKHGVVKDARLTAAWMRAQKVDGVVGVPVQVLTLARLCPDLALKSVLLSTDHVPDAVVQTIQQTWGCQVYNHYGMTEMGLGGGVDCGERHGYHLREADLYFEIVHPVTGAPVTPGETGEVVFTTLTRRGMPLVRYRTGDLSRFIPGKCPCGTGLKTLAHVRTRRGGTVTLGEYGSVSMAGLDEALFSLAGICDYQASLLHTPGQERLRLLIKTIGDPPAQLGAEIEEALNTLAAIRFARQAHAMQIQMEIQKLDPRLPAPVKRTLTEGSSYA
ncbi:MAG: AMP-binding protein [Anaerolineaceae bacterium]|jgi:phenylacetate-CoA ligase|nr:AMP-binding protein [Anaerolineaceae bacterium]